MIGKSLNIVLRGDRSSLSSLEIETWASSFPSSIGGLLVPHYADAPNPYQEQIRKGREFLLAKLKNEKQVGYLGLGVMALIKTAPNHLSGPNKGKTNIEPALQTEIDRFVGLVEGKPHDFKEQEGTYALGVTVSCLLAHDTGKHERLIRRLVAEIIARQKPNGCWTYPSGGPENGDTSQVQYITLALWDAAVAGIEVPPSVWDSVMWWQIATQDATGQGGPGGFVYQPGKFRLTANRSTRTTRSPRWASPGSAR